MLCFLCSREEILTIVSMLSSDSVLYTPHSKVRNIPHTHFAYLSIHPFICLFVHLCFSFICPSVHPPTHPTTHPPIHPSIHPSIYSCSHLFSIHPFLSFTHLPTCSLIHSTSVLFHSLAHSLTHSLTHSSTWSHILFAYTQFLLSLSTMFCIVVRFLFTKAAQSLPTLGKNISSSCSVCSVKKLMLCAESFCALMEITSPCSIYTGHTKGSRGIRLVHTSCNWVLLSVLKFRYSQNYYSLL